MNHGAVSHETCLYMVKNLNKISKTNISVSITGVAGPKGGTKQKPVGLVYMALSANSNIISKKFNFLPDRKMHRQISANVAMNMIRKYIIENYD